MSRVYILAEILSQIFVIIGDLDLRSWFDKLTIRRQLIFY